jgi:TPR repeat protein
MTTPRHFRVFLSSPGDVSEERVHARKVIKDELPSDPFLRSRATLEIVSWDDPSSPTPMLASLTPQEAIDRGLPKPSECDFVVIILWGRFGTPLPDSTRKPNGERYLSGTEWEYEDAISAKPQPEILIYRRTEKVLLDADDPELPSKLEQRKRVNEFFERFRSADGSYRAGVNTYDTSRSFAERLKSDLRTLLAAKFDGKRATVENGRAGLPKDDREAARVYKLAADQGNAIAQTNLALFYEVGRGGLPKDDREAARLYKLAADQGNAIGQRNLALFYEVGRGGLPKDDCEAARLYKLAADQGDAYAQNKLGIFYEDGRGGLPKDDHEAVLLFMLAADQGDAYAQNNLALCYENGSGGLQKDDREAVRLYKLAVDQGDAYAQSNLALFYEVGRGGLPKDDCEAARLYKLAADQGDAKAQSKLGFFYQNGRGRLPRNYREAARLYKLAADQGNVIGQRNLALFYEVGRGGLPKDDREAARLYKFAADQGDAKAQAALRRLAPRLRQRAYRERQRLKTQKAGQAP